MAADPLPHDPNRSRASIVQQIVAECKGGDAFFDGLAWLASRALASPHAQVTLVDDRTSWWVGCAGIDGQRSDPIDGSFCQYVIAANGPILIEDARVHPLTSSNPWIERKGIVAWAGYPIHGLASEVLGTVCVIDTVQRLWTDDDRRSLEVLASSAQAEVRRRVQSAEWHRSESALAVEVDGRRQIESRAVRTAELTRRLGSCTTVDDVAGALVEVGARLLDASFAVVATADAERRHLLVRGSTQQADPVAAEPGHGHTISIDESSPLADAVRTGRPVVIVDRARRFELYPDLADSILTDGLVSTAAIPLCATDGVVIGVLALGWTARVELSVPEWALLDTTAELCAQTMERCKLADARRDLVVSLQRELLPIIAPIPGLDIAVRYTPARHELGFGGDWYDVIVVDADRTALIVGDVCGHGVRAAARMAEIRSTVGALVRLLPNDLGSVLDRAEVMLAHFDDPFVATVAVLVVDPARETLSFVSAGHPPPAVVHPDGSSSVLDGGRRAVLGAGGTGSVTPGLVHFYEGAVVAAFTDGLVERRDRPLDEGISELVAALSNGREQNIDALADQVVDHLGEHPYDDVALLIVRRGRPAVGRPLPTAHQSANTSRLS